MTTDLIDRVFGGDIFWDDLRVPVTSTLAAGSNPPEFSRFKTNGAVPAAGYALQFDGVNDYATIPHNDSTATPVFDFASSWSFSCWTVINAGNPNNATLLYHPQWDIRIAPGARFRVSLSGHPDQISTGVYNVGARQHLVMIVNESGGTVNLIVYVNTVQVLNISVVGTLAADAGGNVTIFSNAGTSRFMSGKIDDLRFYNSVLSASDIANLYNNEAGTSSDVQPANTTSHYKVNEGSGTVSADYKYGGAATHTMSLTNGVLWTTGMVNITDAEQGVFAWAFSPDSEQELFFTVQIPHTWIEYASIEPHVHWSPSDNNSGNVVWGLEYTWANIGMPFGNTAIKLVTAAAGGLGYHIKSDFDSLDGEDKVISSMLICRIFRKAFATEDTYANVAYLLEVDFHYEYDRGSRMENIK